MLSLRPLASSAFALVALTATLGLARTAHATPSLKIDKAMTLADDQPFDELTIEPTGVLNVKSKRGMGSGLLHIRARKIIVKAGGIISATKAGFPGVNAADGSAEMSSGGGKRSTIAGQPGGGGGYFGPGASGADDKCAAFAESAGGVGFAMPSLKTPIFGSAGGAANVTSAASAGGDGGGVIILEAAEIQIDGTVEANGESPMPVAGVARGGGSGGFIAIVAAHLTGAGTISASGGAGPAAPGAGPIKANSGGGGAGGTIFVRALDMTQALQDNLDLKGGATGSCPLLTAAGGQKDVKLDDPTFCVDADHDTHFSTICGGDDCDDSDGAIHPEADELCNDVDDNCNGTRDEGDSICPAGRTCDSTVKMCVDISDAGTDAGPVVDAGPPPDHIAFESGCSFHGGGEDLGAVAAAALGIVALLTRRRHASRSEKARR